MAQAPNALAAAGRALPLPDAARQRVASFLELYPRLPASTAVMRELLKASIYEDELCIHTVDASTGFVLSWTTLEEPKTRTQPAKIIMLIQVKWEAWLKADQVPWSRDVIDMVGPERLRYFRRLVLTSRNFDTTPDGMRAALEYAHEIWERARLGPCPDCFNCGPDVTIRLRLNCSKLCLPCTLRRSVKRGRNE